MPFNSVCAGAMIVFIFLFIYLFVSALALIISSLSLSLFCDNYFISLVVIFILNYVSTPQ